MAEQDMLILVVDDEQVMRQYVQRVLQIKKFRTVSASNGLEALALLQQEEPDLIILDLMMPHMDGLTTCRQIRRTSTTPIIVLSALDDEPRKVDALESGADDYLTKPFGAAELTARVKAVLRRVGTGSGDSEEDSIVRVGDLEIDLPGNTVLRHGEPLRLTKTELNLLRTMAQHAGKVVTHRSLLKKVWGPEYGDETAYLHVYMGRLRRKIEEDPSNPRHIITEPGIGYRLLG